MQKGYAALVFTIIALLLPILSAASGDIEVGRVTRLAGDVIVLREGEEQPLSLKLLRPVLLGDTIKTREGSSLQVVLDNGSVLDIAEGSELVIDDYIAGGEARELSVGLSLLIGKIRAIVGKIYRGEGSFEITTPNAVAGVVGTDFIVEYGDGTTKLFVLAGTVEFRHLKELIKGRVMVMEGFRSSITGDKPPEAAEIMNKDTMEEAVEGVNGTDGGDKIPLTHSGAGGSGGMERPAYAGWDIRDASPREDVLGRDYITPQELGTGPASVTSPSSPGGSRPSGLPPLKRLPSDILGP